MTIKITIQPRKATKNNLVPVYISFANMGKTAFHSLGIFVPEHCFDKKTFSVIPPDKNARAEYQRYNTLIQSELSRARNLLLSLQIDRKDYITPAQFKQLYLGNPKNEDTVPITFSGYFDVFIENKDGRTKEIYQTTLNKIEKYFGQNIDFEDVGYSWLDAFNRKLKKEGLVINARSIHFRNIRAVFNKAIDEEIIGLEVYPFRRFKIEREKTRKRAITLNQLRALFGYSGSGQENWAVDMAKLIFFLIGINVKDLYNLSEEEGGMVHYKRAKTGTLYSIKIEPEAAALMKKYKGEKNLLNFKEQFQRSRSFMVKINDYLGEVSKKIKCPKITTYTLRHTWATLAAELEIPKETIAAALGHSQNATVTDVYIDFNRKKVDEANRRVIDCCLSNPNSSSSE